MLKRLASTPALTRSFTRLGLLVGVPSALVLGVQALGVASPALKTWNTGDVLSATDLNSNFSALANAIPAPPTPTQIVNGFNGATDAGATVVLGPIVPAAPQYDLRWMVQHGAAAAACAAASPPGDSVDGHVVLAKPSGATCMAACAANTGGTFTNCRTSIAVGSIVPSQATSYMQVLGMNYNYGCGDSQAAYDEVNGQGASSSYTAYCCCYH